MCQRQTTAVGYSFPVRRPAPSAPRRPLSTEGEGSLLEPHNQPILSPVQVHGWFDWLIILASVHMGIYHKKGMGAGDKDMGKQANKHLLITCVAVQLAAVVTWRHRGCGQAPCTVALCGAKNRWRPNLWGRCQLLIWVGSKPCKSKSKKMLHVPTANYCGGVQFSRPSPRSQCPSQTTVD